MFALAILAAPVFAGYLNDVNEVIAGNQIGIGAKQMAMGGTGMMTIDGTAIFYNPANLTRIPRIEFMLGMSYNKQKSDITTRVVGEESGFDVSDSKSNTRISSAILTVPYPTYRGALVFGFGVARLSDFDRISNFYFEEIDEGEVRTSNEKVKESGGLNQWAFGFGIDLSPRISFGGALMVYHGKHELNLKSPLYYAGAMESDFEQLLEYRYIGYGAKIGLGMQLSRRIGLGMAIESPVMLDIDQDGSEIEFGIITPYSTVEYELKKPFVFSAGAVSRFDYFVNTLRRSCDRLFSCPSPSKSNIVPASQNKFDKLFNLFKGLLLELFGFVRIEIRQSLPFFVLQNRSRDGIYIGAGLKMIRHIVIKLRFIDK